MANLTLAIEDDLLRAARVKAVQQGTSVNEVCRQAVERFVDEGGAGSTRAQRLHESFARALRRPAGSATAWSGREELYADRVAAPAGKTR